MPFSTYHNTIFTFNPTTAGTYAIDIKLTDNNINGPKSSDYTLYLKVSNNTSNSNSTGDSSSNSDDDSSDDFDSSLTNKSSKSSKLLNIKGYLKASIT